MLDKNEEKTYNTYYIAFLDMLGFKRLVNNESNLNYILKIFEKITHDYLVNSKVTDEHGKSILSSERTHIITTKIISDSICLYIDAENEQELMYLIFACSLIQWELANLETPIFLRGSIVKGKLFSDGNIIFGPGLTKAYLLEEQNARVPRIIMTNDILLPLRTVETQYGETSIDHLLFKDYDAFYVVDYFSRINFYRPELNLKARLLRYAESVLDSETDLSVREKYLYIINNINEAFSRITY